MKMHFGQLQGQANAPKGKDPLKTGIPAWVPPAWIIPLIDSNNRNRKPVDDRPRVEIPVDERVPEDDLPFREPQEDGDRGVVIIEFGGRKKDI